VTRGGSLDGGADVLLPTVLTDTTLAYLPFDGDADGSLISTAADTNRFFSALLGGRLLAPRPARRDAAHGRRARHPR
jgi:hypothetical protein